MFSKTCKYAIRATIFIAFNSLEKKRSSLNTIAMGINSPKAFTAKILQKLVKQNILKSIRGPQGGFYIDDAGLKSVRIGNIMTAIDGDKLLNSCGLGLKKCSDVNPCPIHNQWKNMKEDLNKILFEPTLYDLALKHKDASYLLI